MYKKIVVIVCACLLFTSSLYAGDYFLKADKLLPRVGLDGLKHLQTTAFKDMSSQLDSAYQLRVGDQVTVSLWGRIEGDYEATVNRNGFIVIPRIGKLYVLDMSLQAVTQKVKEELDSKFTNVDVELFVSDVQNITVSVLGNAVEPGRYYVSPQTKLAEIVSMAGGPTKQGSLIDIKLLRNNETIASFNAYEFILKGDFSNNPIVQENDVIHIGLIKPLIALRGDVLFPGLYEIDENATLKKYLSFAGGLKTSYAKKKVVIARLNPESLLYELYKEIAFNDVRDIAAEDDVVLQPYDSMIVTSLHDYIPESARLFDRMEITGAVALPGTYMVEKGTSLRVLLEKAGGVTENAFLPGAVLKRVSLRNIEKQFFNDELRALLKKNLSVFINHKEKAITEDQKSYYHALIEQHNMYFSLSESNMRTKGRLVFDLQQVLNGDIDIVVEDGDTLFIPVIPEWVYVIGDVIHSTAIYFKDNKDASYYLQQAGGIAPTADKQSMHIIRTNGSVERFTNDFPLIKRGDIIVVPKQESTSH